MYVLVLKNHRGYIIKMYYGTIHNRAKKGNGLWSIIFDLRGAFLVGENLVILESDSPEVVKGWEDWR